MIKSKNRNIKGNIFSVSDIKQANKTLINNGVRSTNTKTTTKTIITNKKLNDTWNIVLKKHKI